MNERRKPPRGPLLTTVVLGAVWILTLVTGVRSLFSYETSPGSVGKVQARWPVASKISAPNERPILVMVAHPRCPCTRASMDELAKIMARMQGKVAAYVLFLTPSSLPRAMGGYGFAARCGKNSRCNGSLRYRRCRSAKDLARKPRVTLSSTIATDHCSLAEESLHRAATRAITWEKAASYQSSKNTKVRSQRRTCLVVR